MLVILRNERDCPGSGARLASRLEATMALLCQPLDPE